MNSALRLLRVRGRSEHELKLALERRGYDSAVRAEVLEKLRGFGYLDDAKFAKDRAVVLLRNGRFGERAVLQRLKGHGLSDAEARDALSAAREELEFDPLSTARAVLQKRGLFGRPLSPQEKAKAARLLSSRGFSEDVVRALVGADDGGD